MHTAAPDRAEEIVSLSMTFARLLQAYHHRQHELLEALHNDAVGLEAVEWLSEQVREDAVRIKQTRIRLKQLQLQAAE